MTAYAVCYDLNSPGQDYKDLIDAIKAFYPTYWHHLDSTWLVVTNDSAQQIKEKLNVYLDNGDELLVMRCSSPWYSAGLTPSALNWLHANM